LTLHGAAKQFSSDLHLALFVDPRLLDRLEVQRGTFSPCSIIRQNVFAAVSRFAHKVQRFLGKLIANGPEARAILERSGTSDSYR
jgi:hypothetical protein